MGLMDKLRGAAESAQNMTSKVGVGADSGQMALANKAQKLMKVGVDTPATIDSMDADRQDRHARRRRERDRADGQAGRRRALHVTINQYVYPSNPMATGDDGQRQGRPGGRADGDDLLGHAAGRRQRRRVRRGAVRPGHRVATAMKRRRGHRSVVEHAAAGRAAVARHASGRRCRRPTRSSRCVPSTARATSLSTRRWRTCSRRGWCVVALPTTTLTWPSPSEAKSFWTRAP